MSADPNACYCGGVAGDHVVDCPAQRAAVIVRARGALVGRVGRYARLVMAAYMVFDVRPTNWADDADPDSVAAWSALEEALRACKALPS